MKHFPRATLVASARFAGLAAHAEMPSSIEMAIAEDAFVYGYPRLLMDITEQQMTKAPTGSWLAAPLNRLGHATRLPTPDDRTVVRPNLDTLYSSAWLNLSQEPMVLHVPETAGRYYIMEILDAWTNVFAAPSTRTAGSGPRDYAILGPGYRGALPDGLTPLPASTAKVWLIGRTLVQGAGDEAAARAVQQGFKVVSLSQWTKGNELPPPVVIGAAPGIPRATPPTELAEMAGLPFLQRLAEILQSEPAPARDTPMLQRMTAIDFLAGQPYAPRDTLQRILEETPKRALARIEANAQRLGVSMNGWRVVLRGIGDYGTHYDVRAAIARMGLGANLPEDAVYPTTWADRTGQPLRGNRRYVLHFAPGQLPPVRAFWSLTLYDAAGYLVANPEGRYAIRNRDPLVMNLDGSLDLEVGGAAPSEEARRPNWLPAPAGAPFNLTLRLYWPMPAVLSGAYRPPPIDEMPPR